MVETRKVWFMLLYASLIYPFTLAKLSQPFPVNNEKRNLQLVYEMSFMLGPQQTHLKWNRTMSNSPLFIIKRYKKTADVLVYSPCANAIPLLNVEKQQVWNPRAASSEGIADHCHVCNVWLSMKLSLRSRFTKTFSTCVAEQQIVGGMHLYNSDQVQLQLRKLYLLHPQWPASTWWAQAPT